MAVQTLVPNGTIVLGGWTVSGTSAHAALSDNSDGTYVQPLTSSTLILSMSDPTWPTTAKIVRFRFRFRIQRLTTSPSATMSFSLRSGQTGVNVGTFASTTMAWETSAWFSGADWTRAMLTSATLYMVSGSNAYEVTEASVEVEYNLRPVATLDPLGTVTNTSRPIYTWAYSDAEGDPQAAFQLIVREGTSSLGPIVHDSGWVWSSATSYAAGPNLVNGKTYSAYLQVRQQWTAGGVHESAVNVGTFSINLTTPVAPDVVAVPYHDGGVATVEISDPGGVGKPAAQWYSVVRVHDGVTVPVRGAGNVLVVSPSVLVADYEVPLYVEVSYVVRSHVMVEGFELVSDRTTRTVTVESQGRWITDPYQPDLLNVRVQTRSHEVTWSGRDVVHEPAGMDIAVVESEPTLRRDALSFWSLDESQNGLLVAALRNRQSLLYRDWRSTVYFRWHGDRTSNQHGKDWHGVDVHSGNMVEVARPS